MQLSAISFREHAKEPSEWILRKVGFGDVNLLVGRNATGKTRSLNIINALSNLLAGQTRQLPNGEWAAEFVDQNDLYIYKLTIKNSAVAFEKLGRVQMEKNESYLRGGNREQARYFTRKPADWLIFSLHPIRSRQ